MSRSTVLRFLVVFAILVPLLTLACYCPPPPPHADCSPGFWKQPQHFDYWVGISPDDDYSSGMTYLEALQGGKETQESRFIVAAMLNTNNPYAPCDD